MGKSKSKNKNEVPNPTSVTNRDILQRLNFLYQASVFLNGLASPSSTHDAKLPRSSKPRNDKDAGMEGDDPSHPKRSQRKRTSRVVSLEELSRSYVETMKSVGQKTNVRMDPSMKRRICKRCSAPLVPGISATVRVQDSASHGHLIAYRCHCCQTERRIPAPPVFRVDSPTDEDTMENQPAEGPTSSMSVATAPTRSERQKRKKRGPQPRLLPHFARDGHIVFRGNERLDEMLNTS